MVVLARGLSVPFNVSGPDPASPYRIVGPAGHRLGKEDEEI